MSYELKAKEALVDLTGAQQERLVIVFAVKAVTLALLAIAGAIEGLRR